MSVSYCNTNHILVGLGGTGGKILKAFKMRMFEEFTDDERKKLPVALLYVDSTDEMMPKDGKPNPDFRVMGKDASFDQREFLNIKSVDVSYLLDHIDNYPALKGIIKDADAVKKAIGNLGTAAGQMRRAGRLLFAANASGYIGALHDAYSRCYQNSGNQRELFIHIFAGLCGGTGSGSIIDAIVQARKEYPQADIAVYAMIPEMNLPKEGIDMGRYYQNGYAALMELNALQSNRFNPHDVSGDGDCVNVYNIKYNGVANGITLYSNVNENGIALDSFTELPKTVSDYIYSRIFLIKNEEGSKNGDIVRAYTFENCNQFAQEYDELADKTVNEELPVARTKKVNSFGIKRVMYPELRVLKHITYTVGESVLCQFKYNNWRENLGYINEESNKDYRAEFFNDSNLAKWMLDDKHLTYEVKVLVSDKDQQKFDDYWHDKAIMYADEAKQAENPLNDLDDILADFYEKSFRGDGVVEYYKGKERAIPEIAKEIRRTIEHELFAKWKVGDISIVELQKISKLLIEYITEKRKSLDEKLEKEHEEIDAITQERRENVDKWTNKGFLSKKVFSGTTNSFTEHQNILTDYYTSKTLIVAWEFAQKLAAKLFVELGKLDADISAFGQKINDAIDETERLVAAQRKVNKGLEDMKNAIIEVSEEEAMFEFEKDLKIDRVDMPNIARQLRETILPETDFSNFGNLAQQISVDSICDAFDLKLSSIVKIKHEERADSDTKVLGLNILTQLQQKLQSEEEIKSFAFKIVQQSGVYLCLDNNQIKMQVPNNEGDLSPTNKSSINKKVIYVSVPKPENDRQIRFAKSLEDAFNGAIGQGNEITNIVFDMESPRTNELQVVSVSYCYPMRCIEWLATYKNRYERLLASNPVANSILLHSEGDGKNLPSLFVVAKSAAVSQQQYVQQPIGMHQSSNHESPSTPQMPPMPGAPVPPPMPQAEPHVQMFFHIGGQNYGPYDYTVCKQLKQNGQINEQTMAWQQGMAAWSPAGQVPELQNLFTPTVPTGIPPMPPTM